MAYYDDKLGLLQQQCARFRQLSSMLTELRSQREMLSAEVEELESAMRNEQADVERLEGASLAAFFYKLTGKIDEQLDKERREAYAAAMKYNTALRELEGVENDIQSFSREYDSLYGCIAMYEAALREKAAALKASGGIQAQEILRLEERLGFLSGQKREISEAISAGNDALETVDSILSSLDSAEGWGTLDILGGGLFTDLAKHGHLDDAQASIELLQSQLRRLKTELSDVRVQADLQVNVDGFLLFADYFFDNFFSDWAVMDRISQSKNQVFNTRSQIEALLARLESMETDLEREQSELKDEISKVILNSKL